MNTIMIVDNKKDIQSQIRSMLDNDNFEVLSAENNRKAIEFMNINEDSIKLLLIDSFLPDTKTPALFSIKPNTKKTIDTSNPKDFLKKPFTKQELIDFVNSKV